MQALCIPFASNFMLSGGSPFISMGGNPHPCDSSAGLGCAVALCATSVLLCLVISGMEVNKPLKKAMYNVPYGNVVMQPLHVG